MNDFTGGSLDESAMFGFASDPIEAAKKILRDGAPFAASAITTMSTDEAIAPSVRLNAAKYIIDRQLGPVGGQGEGADDLLAAFLEELNDVANGKAPKSSK